MPNVEHTVDRHEQAGRLGSIRDSNTPAHTLQALGRMPGISALAGRTIELMRAPCSPAGRLRIETSYATSAYPAVPLPLLPDSTLSATNRVWHGWPPSAAVAREIETAERKPPRGTPNHSVNDPRPRSARLASALAGLNPSWNLRTVLAVSNLLAPKSGDELLWDARFTQADSSHLIQSSNDWRTYAQGARTGIRAISAAVMIDLWRAPDDVATWNGLGLADRSTFDASLREGRRNLHLLGVWPWGVSTNTTTLDDGNHHSTDDWATCAPYRDALRRFYRTEKAALEARTVAAVTAAGDAVERLLAD